MEGDLTIGILLISISSFRSSQNECNPQLNLPTTSTKTLRQKWLREKWIHQQSSWTTRIALQRTRALQMALVNCSLIKR